MVKLVSFTWPLFVPTYLKIFFLYIYVCVCICSRMICQSLVSLVKRHAQPLWLEFQFVHEESTKESTRFLVCLYAYRYLEELEFCVGSINVSHSFSFKVLRIIVEFLGFLISMRIIKFCSSRNSF